MLKNPIVLRVKKLVRDRCPILLCAASRVASRTVMFREERAFLGGKRVQGEGHPTVLFFSTFRCGTQRVDSILRKMCDLLGMQALNLGGYWFHRGVVREGEITSLEVAEKLYPKKNYYLGRIRPIEPEFDLSSYRVVTIVRDPRDIMVSYFYSMAYAHTPLNRKYAQEAEEVREKGIEWFVKQPRWTGVIGRELRHLRDHTWKQPGSFSWRFEDMMANFGQFLGDLADHLEVGEQSAELRAAILADQNETVSQGGSSLAHFRSGQSGQFREKLSPETADFLTEEFADLLEAFGYEK